MTVKLKGFTPYPSDPLRQPVLFDTLCKEFNMGAYEMADFIEANCIFFGRIADLICNNETYVGYGVVEQVREKLGDKKNERLQTN